MPAIGERMNYWNIFCQCLPFLYAMPLSPAEQTENKFLRNVNAENSATISSKGASDKWIGWSESVQCEGEKNTSKELNVFFVNRQQAHKGILIGYQQKTTTQKYAPK